ncbi:hypothetical protein, partial [Paenibacillus larvae]|uniref:hypothetical protein n=2 Tax=Paenibacillus larvae TaxID=1464 RepID=UPI0030C99508
TVNSFIISTVYRKGSISAVKAVFSFHLQESGQIRESSRFLEVMRHKSFQATALPSVIVTNGNL